LCNERSTQAAEKPEVPVEKKEEEKAPKNNNADLAKVIEIPINCLYMILGLPICFLGYRYLKASVIIVGTVGGNIFFLLILTICWDWYAQGSVTILCVIIGCFLTALMFGILLHYLPKFGCAVTGFVTGAVFGMQVYGITCAVKGGAGPAWLLLVLVGVFAVSGIF